MKYRFSSSIVRINELRTRIDRESGNMMKLKAIVSTLSIVPRFTGDFGVHRLAIADNSATQNRISVARLEIHLCKQQASPDHTPESNHRDTLVPLIKAIATRIQASLPFHVDLDDLIQAGTLGLTDATNTFDATKQIPFSSYAKHRIKGAILDGLRDLDKASQDTFRTRSDGRTNEAATVTVQ